MSEINVLKNLGIDIPKEDFIKLRRELRNHGYKISEEGIYLIWSAYSKKQKTKWADIPKGDELWLILRDYVKR
ncbi:MAG: hypothetical protein MUF15_23830 [Acidobacteria bacterium]|nr:hypothetical protein [Acidobacteriota bacterium]